jgi:hypothetical protein
MPSGYIDLRDIGKWVARIVADARTLNKAVFAFNTVLTTNQIYEVLERVSGETIERIYVSLTWSSPTSKADRFNAVTLDHS